MRAITIASILAALAAPACAKQDRKVEDCNAVIDVVNKGVEAVQAVGDEDRDGTVKLGAAYGSVAVGLDKLQITTTTLQPIVAKLKASASGAAAAIGAVAQAADKDAASEKAVPLVEAYNQAAKDLQGFCGPNK